MRVIIEHPKWFMDYETIKKEFLRVTEKSEVTEIIVGSTECTGKLGAKLAYELGVNLTVFPPDIPIYGRDAGKVKNEQMVANGDLALIFWDEEDKCIANLIHQAEDKDLDVIVYTI